MIYAQADLPDYSNCVLSVCLNRKKGSIKIARPKWVTIAGKLCLVGTWPDNPTTTESFAGVELVVAWKDVTDYIVFASTNDYELRMGSGPCEHPPRPSAKMN